MVINLGQVRGDYMASLELKINDIIYLLVNQIEVISTIIQNNRATFQVDITNIIKPVEGDKVEFREDTTLVFSGFVKVVKAPRVKSGFEQDIYKITALGNNTIARNLTITDTFEDVNSNDVIEFLFDNRLLADENVTIGLIDFINLPIDKITYQSTDLFTLLDELAGINESYWDIDHNKIFKIQNLKNSPIKTFTEEIEVISYLENDLYYANIIIIESDAVIFRKDFTEDIDVVRGSNLGTKFAMFAPVRISGIANSLIVEESSISPDEVDNFITFKESDKGISIGKDTPISVEGLRVLTYQPARKTQSKSMNTTEITKRALQTGGSGKVERVIIDDTLNTSEEQFKAGQSALDQFSELERILMIRTRDITAKDYNIGERLNINIPKLFIDDLFTIIDINTLYYPDSEYVEYTFTLKIGNLLKKPLDESITRAGKIRLRASEVVVINITTSDNIVINVNTKVDKQLPLMTMEESTCGTFNTYFNKIIKTNLP